MLSRRTELILGLFFLGLSLFAVLVWIPLDSETGMIETFRRQTTMGDAFLPTVAGALMAICAVVHVLASYRRTDNFDTENPTIDGNDLAFLLQLFGITALSIALFYWAGPIAVSLFAQGDGGEVVTYRQMRSTYPYKLIGFVMGGFTLVFLTTALIEGRVRAIRIISSLLVVAILIAIFDLPLDNVLLPPNGDW